MCDAGFDIKNRMWANCFMERILELTKYLWSNRLTMEVKWRIGRWGSSKEIEKLRYRSQ